MAQNLFSRTVMKNKNTLGKNNRWKSLYEPATFGTLRCPLLPASDWNNRFEIARMLSDPSTDKEHLIRLAVYCASRGLDTHFESNSTSKKSLESFRRKLAQYVGRMAIRATPFGVFSGVGVFENGDKCDVRIDYSDAHANASIDSEWLSNYLNKKRAAVKRLRPETKVTMSSRVRKVGDRLYVVAAQVNSEPPPRISIGASEPVLFALKHSIPASSLDELTIKLCAEFGVQADRAKSLLDTLIDQGLLSTSADSLFVLDFALDDDDAMRQSEAGGNTGEVIQQLNLSRSRFSLDRPKGCLLALKERQKFMVEIGVSASMHELQVDTSLGDSFALNSLVSNEISSAATLLLKLSGPPNIPSSAQKVSEMYKERYADGTQVPFREFCTETVFRELDNFANPEIASQSRSSALSRMLLGREPDSEPIVRLTDDSIVELDSWNTSLEMPPEGVDLVCTILGNSPKEVDDGAFRLLIGSNIGANGSGKLHGRFLHLLGNGFQRNVQSTRDSEQQLAGCHFAEVLFPAMNARLRNVVARQIDCQYEILFDVGPSGQAEPLHPNQLTVAMFGNQFRFFCMNGEVQVRPTMSHMLNSKFVPDSPRLMLQLAAFGYRKLASFSWGPFEGAIALPRVEYGKTILRPAEWRLSPRLDRIGKDRSDFAFELRRWRKSFSVPREVYLAQADNRLLLDLEDAQDIAFIFSEVRKLPKNSSLVFHEALPSPADAWAKSNYGNHIVEATCSLLLAGDSKRSEAIRQMREPRNETKARRMKASFPIGSEWLYAKIYAADYAVQDLLSDAIKPFVDSLRGNRNCSKWFFVRFADSEPHVRLRLKSASSDQPATTHRLFLEFIEFASRLQEQQTIERFSLDEYQPEAARYGGSDFLEFIHALFTLDSDLVGEQFQQIQRNAEISDIDVALVSLDAILEIFLRTNEAKVEWLNESMPNSVESGRVFRDSKEKLRSLLGGSAAIQEHMAAHVELTEKYRGEFRVVGDQLEEATVGIWTKNDKSRVLGSLLHMHCNRFFGIDRSREMLCNGLLRHTLRSLEKYPLEIKRSK